MLSRTSDQGQIVNDIRVELDETFQKIQKCKFRSERRQLYAEVRQLRKDFKAREKLVLRDIIKNANVVLSTLNGCGAKVLWGEKFDVVIIDEATQALEAVSIQKQLIILMLIAEAPPSNCGVKMPSC